MRSLVMYNISRHEKKNETAHLNVLARVASVQLMIADVLMDF